MFDAAKAIEEVDRYIYNAKASKNTQDELVGKYLRSILFSIASRNIELNVTEEEVEKIIMPLTNSLIRVTCGYPLTNLNQISYCPNEWEKEHEEDNGIEYYRNLRYPGLIFIQNDEDNVKFYMDIARYKFIDIGEFTTFDFVKTHIEKWLAMEADPIVFPYYPKVSDSRRVYIDSRQVDDDTWISFIGRMKDMEPDDQDEPKVIDIAKYIKIIKKDDKYGLVDIDRSEFKELFYKSTKYSKNERDDSTVDI